MAGLTSRLEMFVDAEPVVWLRNDREDLNRGDVTLGLKYRFFDPAEREGWPALDSSPSSSCQPPMRRSAASGRTSLCSSC